MNGLSAAGLADLAGVTEAEVRRLVDLGVLVPRDGAGPFRETDVQKVRLATACEQAGLPMDGIAAATLAGRLSFAFLEAQQYQRYQRYGAHSSRTYRQVSQETGVRLELLRGTLESAGFAWSAPDDPMREDELGVVPLLQRVAATGILDLAWMTRIGRAWSDGLRLAAKAESEAYHLAGYTRLTEERGDQAAAGQVLVSQSVLEAPPPDGVRFVELGEVQLKGFARPVRLLEVCRGTPTAGGHGLPGPVP